MLVTIAVFDAGTEYVEASVKAAVPARKRTTVVAIMRVPPYS
jgi:4-aminobutyrate aminotransferase-like enzyme